MKRIFLLLTIFCFALKWQPVWAQNGFDLIHDFCVDTNRDNSIFSAYADTNRFFVFGVSATMPQSPQHALTASFDYAGQLQWVNKLFYPGYLNSSSSYVGLVKAGTGKYVAIGTIIDQTTIPTLSLFHPYFYIFNSNGDSILYKSQVDSLNSYFTTVYVHGDFIVTAGFCSNKTFDSSMVWICKYDMGGNVLWQKKYLKSPRSADPCRITLSADKQHYAISGEMVDTATAIETSYLMLTDTMGNLVSLKELKKKYKSWNKMDIVTNPTGGYYFTSSYSKAWPSSGTPQKSNVYFGKLDEDGDTLWTRTLSDSLYYAIGWDIAWSNDPRYLLIHASGNGETIPALIKIDTLGNILWYHRIQHHYNFSTPWNVPLQKMRCMSVSPNEQYLMGGYAMINGDYQSWMILTDSTGCRYPNDPACWPLSVPGSPASKVPGIYPNPVNEQLTIEGVEKRTMVQVTNIIGQTVYKNTVTSENEIINTAYWLPGTYILLLTNEQGLRTTRKIIKN